MDQHAFWMEKAYQLAGLGRGMTTPNPMVGCVIVENGIVLSQGWHKGPGTFHAEREALLPLMGRDLSQATLYVNLEPCCHYGRTPPCTEIILQSGIGRVVVSEKDPNPVVAGKGLEILQGAGVEVIMGVLKHKARSLNPIFYHFHETGKPLCIFKTAMSLDGKIACEKGASQWITGPEARKEVHRWREQCSIILTGLSTVLSDDPHLTVRLGRPSHRQPIPVVLDSKGEIPLDSQLVKQAALGRPLWLAVTDAIPDTRATQLEALGIQLLHCGVGPRIHLPKLFEILAQQGADSILVEAGKSLGTALFKENLVDYGLWFVAPLLLGGDEALHPLGSLGVYHPDQGIPMEPLEIEQYGKDLLLRGTVRKEPRCSQGLSKNEGN